MSVRMFLLRLLAVLGGLLLLAALGEAWVRWRIFGDDPAYADWRDPDLYTWHYTVDHRVVQRDDRDKLAVRWKLLRPDTAHPHALLGWCGELDSASLMPKGFHGTDRPLVLLGAGWAEHHVAPLDSSARVIDLGVPGFSFDQDLMLFDATFTKYQGAHLLLLIDLDRLDHLQRGFVGRPKPWFTMGTYAGDLHGVPVETDNDTYLREQPADPGLYSYHLFRSRVLHDTTMSGSAINSREKDLLELSRKLLFVLLHRAGRNGTHVSVYFEQHGRDALAERRLLALQDLCRELKVPAHVLSQEAEAIGHHGQLAMLPVFLRLALDTAGVTDHTSLGQLKRIEVMAPQQRSPLEQRMASILKDPQWLARVRAKASASGTPLAVMVERDARYMMEHDRR